MQIPDGYRGVLAQKKIESGEREADKDFRHHHQDPVDLTAEDEDQEIGGLEESGTFNEFVVWGHESLADDDDTFVKGVEEWISFSEAVSIQDRLESVGVDVEILQIHKTKVHTAKSTDN